MIESKIQEKTIKLLAAYRMSAFPIEFRGRRGCPDLIVFHLDHPRKCCFLELKTATGKRSEHQIVTADIFLIWGQAVGLVRTPDEAWQFCNKVFYGEETKDTQGEQFQDKARASDVDDSSSPVRPERCLRVRKP